jgi:type II secretory pathway pseudopilin PulG
MPKPSIAQPPLVMMRTFSARLRVLGRSLTGGSARTVIRIQGSARVARGSLASERGDTMIEVLISALLVGLVVVGTLTGFNSATKASYDERAHAQATVCAQQDEERMRGLTTKQLSELGTSSRKVTDTCEPYVEGSGYKGTVYTITSTAQYVNDKTVGTACSPEGSADYLRTTSSVKWAALRTRKEVTQSSIVTNPIGASLLVKIENQVGEGVPGANVTAVGENTNQTQTTNSEGCAIFASLVAPSVTVTVAKTGWVDHEGEALAPETLKLVTGKTTSVTYQLGEAGSIKATFTSKSVGELGDTFVAFQSEIVRVPLFMLEGTISSSVIAASTDYKSPVTSSPKALFPFQKLPAPGSPSPYTVYAGDCEKNNPTLYEAGFVNATAQVGPGEEAPLSKPLELPPVNIIVKAGYESGAHAGLVVGGPSTSASVTDTGCTGIIPTNYFGKSAPSYVHYQPLAAGTGHLTYPGQPYGAFSLCVSGGGRKWVGTFTNNTINGPTVAAVLTPPNNGGFETFGPTKYGVIYLGTLPVGAPSGTSAGSC